MKVTLLGFTTFTSKSGNECHIAFFSAPDSNVTGCKTYQSFMSDDDLEYLTLSNIGKCFEARFHFGKNSTEIYGLKKGV